ncbi:hypothetical protein RHSIM_Rhsim08G0138600 [Rhododendron simsii]|uniref:C3HC-type domain-containing protein n=1 Tax=Rhododendron simsii TaxID=118357 RepID=A0A834LGX6_RHOSS|nr:hypothetical protein RHSIM_Rhsim08G0138600 [Rhododendron simsii]
MAEESEQRFHAIMDRLFHAPHKPKSKSNPTTNAQPESTSSFRVQLSRGKKRPNEGSVFGQKSRGVMVERLQNSSVSGGSVQTPVCRPWDRGDLMSRLVTFKSMTWFAKPQVNLRVREEIRRFTNMYVNDIVSLICQLEFLFRTPFTWFICWVNKAALVFSLKLDNGHKQLCPWIDNTCDEKLSQFPPTPAAVLVDEYKKRFSLLLQLLALPEISFSAIDYMRSPQLENFLRGSSGAGGSSWSPDISQAEHLGNKNDRDSSMSYYQAQKIISLCGWEPRSLPYIVECKDQQCQSSKDAHPRYLSHGFADGHNSSLVTYSSIVDETMEANDGPAASNRVQSDPNSVVLDCRLCRASVGLWTFTTVPRPLEFLRLVGCTEVDSEHDSARHEEAVNRGALNTAFTSATSASGKRLNLSLTIAGGPPPAKQNFRATISLPVIGRNLRSRISSDPDFRDRPCANYSFQGGKSHVEMSLMSCLDEDIIEQGNTLADGNCGISSEGSKSGLQGFPGTDTPDSNKEKQVESSPNCADGNSRKDKMLENTENIQAVPVSSSSHIRDSSVSTTSASETRRDGEIVENDVSTTVQAGASSLEQGPVTGTVCSSVVKARLQPVEYAVLPWSIERAFTVIASHLQIGFVFTLFLYHPPPPSSSSTAIDADLLNPVFGGKASAMEKGLFVQLGQEPRIENRVTKKQVSNLVSLLRQVILVLKLVSGLVGWNNKDQLPSDKAMEFDPIRQHRHFCPWIASTGNSPPGWQKTLSALQRQKEFFCPSSPNASSSSLIEVDDPVASVKKLFTPPSAKRMKLNPGPSAAHTRAAIWPFISAMDGSNFNPNNGRLASIKIKAAWIKIRADRIKMDDWISRLTTPVETGSREVSARPSAASSLSGA